MTDPFAVFMDFWVPSIGETEAFAAYLEKMRLADVRAHYVASDIEPFRANTGAMIEGRAQWREHLRRTGLQEMSVDDLRKGTERHNAAKAERKKFLERATREAPPASIPAGEIRPAERSRATAEVLNRLHGRPTPDRKTLLKLTLDVHKRHANERRR